MPRVYPAEPYRPCALSSFGNASRMLLRQHNFPDEYESSDHHVFADHDRLDRNQAGACLRRHTLAGYDQFESWVRSESATDAQIFNLIIDLLGRASVGVDWTGYRVLGSVNPGNGHTVWTYELFARGPSSKTLVYSEPDAPNVLPGPRH